MTKAKVEAFSKQSIINNGWTYFLDDLKTMLDEYDQAIKERFEYKFRV